MHRNYEFSLKESVYTIQCSVDFHKVRLSISRFISEGPEGGSYIPISQPKF
jgi:hypothetical protein